MSRYYSVGILCKAEVVSVECSIQEELCLDITALCKAEVVSVLQQQRIEVCRGTKLSRYTTLDNSIQEKLCLNITVVKYCVQEKLSQYDNRRS